MYEDEALLHEELILTNYEADSRDELLKNLGGILKEKGYVKDSYIQGILDREKIFPTGLNTEGVKVAIPHTDAKHVNKSGILVAKLNKPVIFKEMADGVNDVDAKLIFMLAIKKPDQQVKVLSKLMSIFSNKEALTNVYNCNSSSQILDILYGVLNK